MESKDSTNLLFCDLLIESVYRRLVKFIVSIFEEILHLKPAFSLEFYADFQSISYVSSFIPTFLFLNIVRVRVLT